MTYASGNVPRKNNPKKKRKNGDGSVYFIIARAKWGAAIQNTHGNRITKLFDVEEDAWAWIVEERKAKHYGLTTVALNPEQKLGDYLLDWVERNKNQKKPSTSNYYRSRIKNQINPQIGHVKTAQLSPRTVEELISNLIDTGLGAGTIRGVYRTLSAAYSDGYRLGDLPANPLERVKMPSLRSRPLRPIPDVDAAIIYSHASQDPFMHARIEMGMVCGLRPGEVLGLLWADIDWESKVLAIKRQVQSVKGVGLIFQSVKQNEERSIYLTDIQMDILRKHKDHQDLIRGKFANDEGLIFPNKVGGKLDHRRDDRMWKRLISESGVSPYARYQMRKTSFTRIYTHLKDARSLMEYSGHSQLSTLMNSYVFPSENFVEEIRNSVDLARPTTYGTQETKGARDVS